MLLFGKTLFKPAAAGFCVKETGVGKPFAKKTILTFIHILITQRIMHYNILSLLFVFLLSVSPSLSNHCQGQSSPQANPTKDAISVADMQAWHQIRNVQIGADGKHVLYTLTPDVGDPTVVVYNLSTKQEKRFPNLHRASFTYDGKHLVGMIKPARDSVKAIKLQEKKKAKKILAEKNQLLVWDLSQLAPRYIAPVYDFKISDRNAGVFAYTTASLLPDSLQRGMDKDARRLVVRKFANQDSFYLEGVKEFMLARDQPVVLAHQMAKDSSWEEGVLRLNADQIRWQTLGAAAGAYTGLTMSHDGARVAFLTSDPDSKDAQQPHHLYLWKNGDETARLLTDNTADWLPAGQRISPNRTPRFSDNGSYLYFGLATRIPERDTTLLDEEIADVEVWRTEDPRLYTQQNVLSSRLAKQTFLSVYRIKQGDFMPLATPEMPYEALSRTANGPWIALYDDRPYLKETTWEGRTGKRNTTLVNLEAGFVVLLIEGR